MSFVVDEIEEERDSRGEWTTKPSIFRKIKFKKEIIPAAIMKEAGYLKTETVLENGKQVEKTYLKL